MVSELPFLLSTAYFGNIHYFSKFLSYTNVYIEAHENFVKQTYRNRANILGANGTVSLIIPVEKGRLQKVPIRDLKIAYDENWQRNHWRTIFSAYNSSPFFEYYADDIDCFFSKKYDFLFDFNLEITYKILEILQINNRIEFTETYEKNPQLFSDYRNHISPKNKLNDIDKDYKSIPYTQVFSEKIDFVPGLSILDLIFNCGPNALTILKKSLIGIK